MKKYCGYCGHKKAKVTDVWYHGSSHRISKFNIDGIGKGNDQYGPGIYLSNDPQIAKGYGDNLHEVYIDTESLRLIDTDKGTPADRKAVKELVLKAPGYRDTLQNWGEDPDKALIAAIDQGIMEYQDTQYERFEQVWYEFYRDDAPLFAKNIVAMGFDGHVAHSYQNTYFLVLLNPNKIKSVKLV